MCIAQLARVCTPASGASHSHTQWRCLLTPTTRLLPSDLQGTLDDGTVFHDTAKSGPLYVRAGCGQLVSGLETALADQPTGTQLTVTVPPELGYGWKRVGDIPAGSTLHFTVHVCAVGQDAQPPAPGFMAKLREFFS